MHFALLSMPLFKVFYKLGLLERTLLGHSETAVMLLTWQPWQSGCFLGFVVFIGIRINGHLKNDPFSFFLNVP